MQLFSHLILATLFARNVLGDIYDSCGGNNCFAIPLPDSDVETCLEQKVLYYTINLIIVLKHVWWQEKPILYYSTLLESFFWKDSDYVGMYR